MEWRTFKGLAVGLMAQIPMISGRKLSGVCGQATRLARERRVDRLGGDYHVGIQWSEAWKSTTVARLSLCVVLEAWKVPLV